MVPFRHSNLFPRISLVAAILFASFSVAVAEPVISEIMASNGSTLADEDGAFADWIELYNPDSAPVSLAGWFLTDSTKKKTKWAIPGITLQPQGCIVIFASGKDRSDPAHPLHTNFSLDASGEYLALVRPDGVTASTEFAPAYPPQQSDISYGATRPSNGRPSEAGYFRKASPGAPNLDASGLMLFEVVSLSRDAGPFAESFALELSGAGSGQHIRYVIAAPSATGASVPEPTASSPAYTGPVSITTSVIVRAAVFSNDDSLRGMPATAEFIKLGPGAGNITSQLPILLLDDHGFGELSKDDTDHSAWLYSYAAKGTGIPVFTAAPENATSVNVSVRGSSSGYFPKKGYNLDLLDDAGNHTSQPLLGLSRSSKWALVGPWYFDHTLIKNSFVYALSNRLGHWAPATQFAEVYFNCSGGNLDTSAYAGVYALTDKIEVDPERVNIATLSPDDITAPAITGGYILKIDAPSDGDVSWITDHGIPANGTSAVIIASPKAEDLNQPQKDYIRGYIQQMENALYSDFGSGFSTRTYLDYIERPSWIDYHILNVLVSNFDALNRSAYFTKYRGSKLAAGPVWDFDRSLGSATYFHAAPWNAWNTTDGADFWNTGWWAKLARDPEFMQDWVDRWQSLRRDQFSETSLGSLADSLAAKIGPEATARDAARWPDPVRFPDGVTGGVATMKTWLMHRVGWIDGQFLAPPTITQIGDLLTFTAPAGAELAYTLDGSDPRALGGAVAPNAVVTNSSLTVSASANIHVRSYRADMVGVFPGSPWSSAASGSNSSPLSPKARLVNLSSRGLVGTGENALIAGVVVADTNDKRFLSRAIGPTLASFGATGILADPQLSVCAENGVEIYRNNGWQHGADALNLAELSKSVGAFPLVANSADSAVAAELSHGAYSLRITSPTGQSGIGLVELYELDDNGRTFNLSTRAFVGSGGNALIGGFVVQGPAYKRVLIRAVGPTLSAFGLANALSDPTLTIYSGQTAIASNDRWSAATNVVTLRNATKTVGAFALAENSEDAALFLTVAPGAFTVVVSGKAESQGIALLEIYEVP